MKRYWIFLFPLALLACRVLSSAPLAAPLRTPTPAASHLEATAFAPTRAFTLVRIHPQEGKLQNLLAIEAQKAQALGQAAFVEYDATWCPSCQIITARLAEKNELMLAAYRGVYLIHLDVDEWGWGNAEAGFNLQVIPIFFKLDQNGRPTGDRVDGSIWGDDIPENIAPALEKFFGTVQR